MEQPRSRKAAQEEADRLRLALAEIAHLERQGALELTPEQKRQLEDHSRRRLAELEQVFDIDINETQRRLSWALRVASTLGGLAVCAAAFLLFLHFWGHFSTWVQVGILAVLPLAALAGTELAARRERGFYFTSILALVSLACFILNLSALGSIFNLAPSQHAMFAWGVFSFLLAYRYGLRLLLIAGLAFALSWVAATACTWFRLHWLSFVERPELLGVCGLAVVAYGALVREERHPEFPAVYRLFGALVFFLAVLYLALAGADTWLQWSSRDVQRFYEVVLLTGAVAAMWAGIRRDWSGLVNTGAAFFVLELYLRLYRWLWDWIPKYLFFGLLGAISIMAVWAFKRLRQRPRKGAA